MKNVVITCRAEDAPNITALLKKRIFMQDEFKEHQRFSLLVPEEDLDAFIADITTALQFMDASTTVEVYSPDFVLAPKGNGVKKKDQNKKRRSPVEKLIESAQDYATVDVNTLALAAIASLVAVIGLFLNNVGIIIGAMLLSPLLGPIYAFAIGTSTGNRTTLFGSLKSIIIFLIVIVLISFSATYVLSLLIRLPLTPEILTRTIAAPIYVVMAILLGFAVMIALSWGIPEGVAGVAVAAALLPPVAVIGICLAIYQEGTAGSLILTFENIGGLIAGSVIGAVALQITPRSYREKLGARVIISRILWVLAVLILVLLFLSLLPI
jgi:uncharacterized hydrophobic protein (TIGR00341 family)